jgi:hypothetical protein
MKGDMPSRGSRLCHRLRTTTALVQTGVPWVLDDGAVSVTGIDLGILSSGLIDGPLDGPFE